MANPTNPNEVGKFLASSEAPSDILSATEIGRRLADRQHDIKNAPMFGSVPFIILHDANGNERIEYLTNLVAGPERKHGTIKLFDADSFIAYSASQCTETDCNIYASMNPTQFVAVLNDHRSEDPGFRDFRAIYTVGASREWDIWTKHDGLGAPFGSTEAFAKFIEDNGFDIVKPDSATMMQIALNFRVNANAQFSVAQRLTDGNIDFGYSNVVNASAGSQAGGKLKIPELFQIKIPVFDGINAPMYSIDARFRYRLKEGALLIWYELIRPHKVRELAFNTMLEQIKKETGENVFFGDPGPE